MKVEIWSDYSCPFCYIGRRQFKAAFRQFSYRDKVEILLHSFELLPDSHPQPGISIYEYSSQVSGITALRAKQMYAQVSDRAEKAEIDYHIEVHQAERVNGVYVQKLTIHYNCIGSIEIPDVSSLPEPDVLIQTRKGVAVSYSPTQMAG